MPVYVTSQSLQKGGFRGYAAVNVFKSKTGGPAGKRDWAGRACHCVDTYPAVQVTYPVFGVCEVPPTGRGESESFRDTILATDAVYLLYC
jgi:hypothetical protein